MVRLSNKISKKYLKITALVLFVLCLVVVVLNSRYLIENPFESTIEWDEPSYSVVRDDGVFAVIDSYGTRVSVVLENDELIGIIGSKSIVSSKSDRATSLAFSGNTILVLDHIMSDNCTEIIGDKILEYSLDGKLAKEIYSTPKDSTIRICNVYSKDGQCYVSAIDRKEHDEAVIAKICDDKVEELHRLASVTSDIFTVTYNVNSDATAIITQDGKLYLSYGEDMKEYNPSSSGYNFTEVVCTDSNSVVCIDATKDEILRFDSNEKYEIISERTTSHVTTSNNCLVFSNPIDSVIVFTNQDNNTLKESSSVSHSFRFRCNVIVTFVCLLFALGYIVFYIFKFISKFISASRREAVYALRKGNVSEKTTVVGILKKMAPVLMMCYLVASFIFSIYTWKTATETAEDNLIDVAVSALYVSKNNVGDKLSKINSEADYGSDNYRDIIDVYDSLCGGYTSKVGFDYGFSIYKYIDNSDDVLVVKDKFFEQRIGTIFTRKEQEAYTIADKLDSAYEGNVQETRYIFANGTKLLCIMLPIYDSQDNVIGAAEISQNYSAVESETFMHICKALVEMLTMMAGFAVILAEIQLAKEFTEIQLAIIESGDKNHTLAEAGHTLMVLSCVIFSTSSIFITLIAKDILSEAGISGSILIALPLTINMVVSNITMVVIVAAPALKARREMNTGAVFIIAGAMIGIAAVKTSGFVLLCVSSAVLSLGTAICKYASDKISYLKKTTDKYNSLESAQYLIAPLIATATGAFVRTYFGNIAVFVFLVLISVVFFILKDLYIGTTVVSMKKKSTSELIEKAKEHLQFSIRPKIFLWILFVTLPILLLEGSTSYIMPLMTQETKSTDIVIALVTIAAELLSLYLAEPITRMQKKFSVNITLVIDFVILAGIFFLFSKLETLQSLCLSTILVFVLDQSLADNQNILLCNEIKASGMTNIDPNVYRKFWEGVLNNFSPLILSAMLLGGYKYFALIFVVMCILCIFIQIVVFRQKTSEESAL